MTKFTIVTITYNAGKLLRPTAESVMSQEYRQIEHIIIDGASEDNTVEIANEYKKESDSKGNGHEIRIVSEPDKGLYDAMNKGLQMATGDYVCFLNAGDRFPKTDTLSVIADNCGLSGAHRDRKGLPAVLYGNTDIIDYDGRFIRHRHLSAPEKLTWKSFRHGMLVCHQAFYARTDIARRTPYDLNYRFSADVDWCIRIMKEAEKLGLALRNAHDVIALYLSEGETTRNHKASLKERYMVMRKHYGLMTTTAMHIWFVIRKVFHT